MSKRVAIILVFLAAVTVEGQTKPAPPPPQPATPGSKPQPKPPAKPAPTKPATPQRPSPIRVRGFVTFGQVTLNAQDSFDAIFESHTAPTFGGGGQVLLPWNTFAELSVFHFSRDGERAFIGPNREVFRLGIPLSLSVTPLEITGGWRYRHCPPPPRPPQKPGAKPPAKPSPAPPRACAPRFIPYAGGGFSSFKYVESSDFDDTGEDVEERFNGFHLIGGAEYQLMRWVAVGGEVAWSSIPDALTGGVAAAFNEDNLGGVSLRVRVVVGR